MARKTHRYLNSKEHKHTEIDRKYITTETQTNKHTPKKTFIFNIYKQTQTQTHILTHTDMYIKNKNLK